MAMAKMDTVIRHLHQVLLRQDRASWTDGQLLTSYIDHKDEAAFEALVRRQGPMVFGVCRRLLHNHHDAEDAFQSTFLVLARKASSVRPRERLANWLHGVALRTAMKAKAMTAKRRGREKQVMEMPEPEAAQQDPWRDLQPLLDRELNGLPERYRLPILLCDLEGKTIKDAAQQLGWPQGSVAGRLARGRKLLAKRLTNRGVALSAGSLAAVVSRNAVSAAVPTALMSTTAKAAAVIAAGQVAVAGVVPAKVAVLMEGVLKTMFLTKLKSLMPVTMAMLAILVGVGLLGYGRATGQQKEDNKAEVVAPNKEVAKSDKDQLLGKWLQISAESSGENRMQPCFKDNVLLVIEEVDGKLVGKTVFKDKYKVLAVFGEDKLFGEDLENRFKVALKLDSRTKPKTLDATSVYGDETELGIYKLDGDTLTWCQSTGKERPTDFSTRSGDGRSLSVYKRQKETEPKRRGSSTKADVGKTDLDRLQGVWSVSCVKGGGEYHQTVETLFMVDGKRACLQTFAGELQGGLYLDATRTPKTFDLAMSTVTIEGIYSLEGDTLKLCYGDYSSVDPKRPSSFLCEKGNEERIVVFFKRTFRPGVFFPYRLADGRRGFPTLIEQEGKTPLPPLMLAPQPAAKVGKIILVGNTKTDASVIRKMIPLHPGDRLYYDALLTADKNLAAFSPTFTVEQSSDHRADCKDVRVTVQEK